MNQSANSRIRQIFLKIKALPVADQETALQRICAGSVVELKEVRALLATDGKPNKNAEDLTVTGSEAPALSAGFKLIGNLILRGRMGGEGFGERG